MDKEIKIGSIVQLKSGSPTMTVDNIDYKLSEGYQDELPYVICKWFVNGEVKTASFHKNSLLIG